MIRRESNRIVVNGPVTLANVAIVLEEVRTHILDGARTLDLGEVTDLDSSLLAAVLAWIREAKRAGYVLTFENLPEGLSVIGQLYGVDEFLAPAPSG